MVEIIYCIACQYGRHEDHTEVIQTVPDGMLGGMVCPCRGECIDESARKWENYVDEYGYG